MTYFAPSSYPSATRPRRGPLPTDLPHSAAPTPGRTDIHLPAGRTAAASTPLPRRLPVASATRSLRRACRRPGSSGSSPRRRRRCTLDAPRDPPRGRWPEIGAPPAPSRMPPDTPAPLAHRPGRVGAAGRSIGPGARTAGETCPTVRSVRLARAAKWTRNGSFGRAEGAPRLWATGAGEGRCRSYRGFMEGNVGRNDEGQRLARRDIRRAVPVRSAPRAACSRPAGRGCRRSGAGR